MADDQRRYSDEEFAVVLRTAAELASRTEHQGLALGGLTLAEMKSAAAQAGIDPVLVERAVQLLGTQSQSLLERLIGGPLRHEHHANVSIALDEEGAARMLSAVRIHATHFHSANAGHSSALGMTWSASDDGNVLSVVARPGASGTTVTAVMDRRGTFVLVGVLAFLAALCALLAGIGLYDVSPVLAPWAATAGVGGTLALARRFWVSSSKNVRVRLAGLMEAVTNTGA